MTEETKSKTIYDLEERTFLFTKNVRIQQKNPIFTVNNGDIKQVIKSSGSVGAGYIEANESLSKKDFLMRMKISRKEAKESLFWLKLLNEINEINNRNELKKLIQETIELKKILSSIIEKSK